MGGTSRGVRSSLVEQSAPWHLLPRSEEPRLGAGFSRVFRDTIVRERGGSEARARQVGRYIDEKAKAIEAQRKADEVDPREGVQ